MALRISRDAWGYVLTAVLVAGIVIVLGGLMWFSLHRPKEPAFVPEWRCDPIPDAEVCERVRPPPKPKSPSKP